jgi:ferredoxin
VALIGARGCDLAGVAVLDRVLRDHAYPDSDYVARRDQIFVLAVHCGSPAGTCFCVSMDTGPRARRGFDLGATEILDGEHRFLIDVATPEGLAIVERVTSRPATPDDLAAAAAVVATAEARMGRTMPATEVRDLLLANLEHPRWQQVADRCLGCANCTMSCPTCFCSNVDDTTDLSGDLATRTRRWDSCFTTDFAYVHGGSVRPSLRARYRQWLTHKLATWHDQFGTSGCVGCGRCITWCPVGIDITEESRDQATPRVTMEDLERVHAATRSRATSTPRVAFVGCAKNVRFRAGEYVIREGDREDTLHLIRQGSVAIEMPRPGGDPIVVETVGAGDVLGVSLMTAAAAHLDCRARETVVAIAIDNHCLHRKMDEDPRLGCAVSQRLLERTYQRLARARLQHLDVYR